MIKANIDRQTKSNSCEFSLSFCHSMTDGDNQFDFEPNRLHSLNKISLANCSWQTSPFACYFGFPILTCENSIGPEKKSFTNILFSHSREEMKIRKSLMIYSLTNLGRIFSSNIRWSPNYFSTRFFICSFKLTWLVIPFSLSTIRLILMSQLTFHTTVSTFAKSAPNFCYFFFVQKVFMHHH